MEPLISPGFFVLIDKNVTKGRGWKIKKIPTKFWSRKIVKNIRIPGRTEENMGIFATSPGKLTEK